MEERISRKDFLKKLGIGAFVGSIALKNLVQPIKAATVTDNLTENGVFRGALPPTNVKLLWIDTTTNPGTPKYYNGTAWVATNSTELDGHDSTYFSTAEGLTTETTNRNAADAALSNRIGNSVGSASRPVYVDANGNVTQCNIWVE